MMFVVFCDQLGGNSTSLCSTPNRSRGRDRCSLGPLGSSQPFPSSQLDTVLRTSVCSHAEGLAPPPRSSVPKVPAGRWARCSPVPELIQDHDQQHQRYDRIHWTRSFLLAR